MEILLSTHRNETFSCLYQSAILSCVSFLLRKQVSGQWFCLASNIRLFISFRGGYYRSVNLSIDVSLTNRDSDDDTCMLTRS